MLSGLFVCISSAQSATDSNRKFTAEQLIDDINFYVKTIKETHVAPFEFISQREWEAKADAVKRRIAERGAMTQQEFWLLFTPLVSSIQDRHTAVVEPRFFIVNNPTVYLPVRALYIDGKVVVTSSVADEPIAKGAIITSINGNRIDDVIRKLSDYNFGSEKERLKDAGDWLWIGAAEVFGKPQSFILSFADGKRVEVKGLTVSEIIRREKAANVNLPKPGDSPLELKFIDSKTAYLNVPTFDYDLEKYKALLTDVFTKIKASGARDLIVDLRSNTGGNSALGNALIEMFNEKPYKNYSSKWKRSAQYVERMKTDGATIPDYYLTLNPGEVYMSKAEIVRPQANTLRFKGKVYVLGSQETFSSGQMFLGAVKENKLAKIIGEETSTPACFPGEQYRFNLPNSGLRVISSVKFWTAPGGDCKRGHGVIPDVPVSPSLNDYLTGKDAILQAALGLIKQRK